MTILCGIGRYDLPAEVSFDVIERLSGAARGPLIKQETSLVVTGQRRTCVQSKNNNEADHLLIKPDLVLSQMTLSFKDETTRPHDIVLRVTY